MYTELALLCVQPARSILDCVEVMESNGRGIVLVTDAERKLMGTVTDGDVRRAVLAGLNLESPIQGLLTRKSGTAYAKPVTAPVGTNRDACLAILKEHAILHLPVVDEQGRVAGLVTRDEFLPGTDLAVDAVLMAGGAGLRLRPLTADTPKPMLPVGNRPLMEIIVRQLRQAGIRNVHVTTHHRPEKITDHFGDGTGFDVQVSYICEEQPLGTAGALGLLEKPRATLLVMNGDILTGLDFRAMVAYHREHEADLTVAVRQYDVQVPFGVVECWDHDVLRITEKPVFNFFVNAGIYLIEPSALEFIPGKGQRLDMTDLIGSLLQANRTVVSFPILEQWLDIGRHEDYRAAQEIVRSWRTES